MLKILTALFLANTCWAQSFKYNLEITPEKYKLIIDMQFQKSILLEDAIRGFKNGKLLVGVSDTIKSVSFKPALADEYVQTMKVKSWGISSILISNCKENFLTSSWIRKCELQTNQEDGGKYMVWKKDVIHCSEQETSILCQADIQGASKAISILGFVLASPQKFSLRAKIPALHNFSQIWLAVNRATLNTDEIRESFEKTKLKSKIDQMLDEGLSVLKAQPSFQFSMEYTEPLS